MNGDQQLRELFAEETKLQRMRAIDDVSLLDYFNPENSALIGMTKNDLLTIEETEDGFPCIPWRNVKKYQEIISEEYEEKTTEEKKEAKKRTIATAITAGIITILATLVTLSKCPPTEGVPPLYNILMASVAIGGIVSLITGMFLDSTNFFYRKTGRQYWKTSSLKEYRGVIPEETLRIVREIAKNTKKGKSVSFSVETFSDTHYDKKNHHFLKSEVRDGKTEKETMIAYWED